MACRNGGTYTVRKRCFHILCLFVLYVHVAIASSVQERLDNRNFPSIFMPWHYSMNLPPSVSSQENVAYHDLIWSPESLLEFERTETGKIRLAGDFDFTREDLDEYRSYNPNILFIIALRMRDMTFGSYFYRKIMDEYIAITDEAGNAVLDTSGRRFLIDFVDPKMQDLIVQQAIAIAKSGFYDGIFFDYWDESGVSLRGYRTFEEEQAARTAILKGIRATVGDDFLIIVNNTGKLTRAAPYINGLFMEGFREELDDYQHTGLIELENILLWTEENFREPQINCLEAEGIGNESPLSSQNQQAMRCLTTLSLTHSDGFVLYTMGVQENEAHQHDSSFRNPRVDHLTDNKYGHGQDPQGLHHFHHHQHYWHDFWDAELGQPMGEKAQRYEGIEGLFIREFTNGWAAYNRSGKGQIIKLPAKSKGVESGVTAIEHTIPDLDGEIFLKVPVVMADLNSDGVVNILDLVIVANALGEAAPDLNGDGVVNILDLVIVANAF